MDILEKLRSENQQIRKLLTYSRFDMALYDYVKLLAEKGDIERTADIDKEFEQARIRIIKAAQKIEL